MDRAALDAAIELGIEYGGWCPQGGWAEDYTAPPGLLALYPKLTATPLAGPEQRTGWNIRDSDATLILVRGSDLSGFPGTKLTLAMAEKLSRNHLLLDVQDPLAIEEARGWFNASAAKPIALNIAGPRESEAPGIYKEAKAFLSALFR